MPLVASVDYQNRLIYLSADSVNAVLDTLDVYREVRALRRSNEAHRRFLPIIVAGGNIEKIPGVSYTAPYVQLLYGARLVPYSSLSHTITLVRDTFTDDAFQGAGCFNRSILDPGVEVDIIVDVPAVEVRVVNSGSGLSPDQALQLENIHAAHMHRRTRNPSTGQEVIYESDGVTPRSTFASTDDGSQITEIAPV